MAPNSSSDDEGFSQRLPHGSLSLVARSQSKVVPETFIAKLKREGSWLTRQRISLHRLLEDPDSSFAARVVGIFVMLVVVFSVICFILESEYEYRKSEHAFFKYAEYFTTGFFLLEYLLRLCACTVFGTQSLFKFFRSLSNLIDFLAILPTFIELLTQGGSIKTLRVLRAVRLVRLFRLLKLGRYSLGMQLIGNTIKRSKSELQVMYFIIGITVVLFGSLIFFLERLSCPNISDLSTADLATYQSECATSFTVSSTLGLRCCDSDDRPRGFRSVFDAFWLCITCFLTVGYGDLTNVTAASKIVGGLSYVLGVVLLSMPIGILSTQFDLVYRETADQTYVARQQMAEMEASLLLAVEHQDLLSDLRMLKNQAVSGRVRAQLREIRLQLDMIESGSHQKFDVTAADLYERTAPYPQLSGIFEKVRDMETTLGDFIQTQAQRERALADIFLHLETRQ